MDRSGAAPRLPMPRSSGVLPPPFGGRDAPAPRGPAFGMRDRPSFQNRAPFSNFQPQLNQYSNNPRGPRLNLIDRNRLGNPNDFNIRNNFNRW